jgi:hypothetical protein
MKFSTTFFLGVAFAFAPAGGFAAAFGTTAQF